MNRDRRIARKLAQESLAQGEALKWFESLYTTAKGDASLVPWADLAANPNLMDWLARAGIQELAQNALVVGCGLGDDAEALAQFCRQVVAFDVSPTAIRWCHRRFPRSSAEYVVADLFSTPPSWHGAFDFVFEAYTLQVLPAELRRGAMERIASLLAPGGTLLLVTRGREQPDPAGDMPWPLLREELDHLHEFGLTTERFEDYWDRESPPVHRFRVECRKPCESHPP